MWQQRTCLLYGEEKMQRIEAAHVLVVGTGGVGAYAAEMLCRAGVGALTLVDADCVAESNINRQLPALHSTVGQPKVEVLAKRFLDINPEVKLTLRPEYLEPEQVDELLGSAEFDFVVDAIDTIAPKVALLAAALRRRQRIVSSMGAGAKLDPSQISVADISKTTNCALAKVVRKRLRGMGISKGIPAVFSKEMANPEAVMEVDNEQCKRTTTGTVSYMPAMFGCYLAAYVVNNMKGGVKGVKGS